MTDLLDGISAELRRRMQGTSCFKLTRHELALFRELGKLTEAGYRNRVAKLIR